MKRKLSKREWGRTGAPASGPPSCASPSPYSGSNILLRARLAAQAAFSAKAVLADEKKDYTGAPVVWMGRGDARVCGR
ncbi:hypothetical protein JCM10449v2_007250 [Rhodotorula kratochvilovae]